MDEKSIYELRQKQKNGATRSEVYERGLLLSSQEMFDVLHSELRTHEMTFQERDRAQYLMREVLGFWVGALRGQALTEMEQDTTFPRRFQNGQGFMMLGKMLQPFGWTDSDMLEYMCLHTGASEREIRFFLFWIGRTLHVCQHKAFEPIGWFYSRDDGFDVLCWNDFLQPVCDGPIELILGDV